MLLVPAGCFEMGGTMFPDQQPVHEICFATPFWIDQVEVTQTQFRGLGGVKAAPSGYSGDNRPVEVITWFEARDFCRLRGGRLPTEAEWEYAARGPDSLIYPWGSAWEAEKVISNRSDTRGSALAGSIPAGASWVGALDMAGNVRELTSSLYRPYPYDPADGREGNTGGEQRVARGGSWFDAVSSELRAQFRRRTNPNLGYGTVGFRCVRDVE